MPAYVSIVHLRTSFTRVQLPFPALSFFTLTESFIFPGKDRKSHSRAHTVPSKTWSCRSRPTCTAVIMSPIYQSILVRLSRVWVGPGPVSGILLMALYPCTKIDVCTRAFTTSASFSKSAQKNLGDSTHPIISNRSMQIIT